MTPQEIVDSAINDYGRKTFYGLLSGGKDSMSVCHYVADNFPDLFKGVLFCDTTIGLQETQDFVKDECQRLGWKLYIRKPPRMSFPEWVKKFGFPKVTGHSMIMRIIKYAAMKKFAYEKADLGEDPCFVGGARRKESIRRMGNMAEPIYHDGRVWFCNPFIDMGTIEVYEYLTEHHLKKSPAYTNLHISGDCLCGSFASNFEAGMIRAFYPEIHEQLLELEEYLKDKNIKSDYKKWGKGGGVTQALDQTTLDILICGECSVNTQ